MADLPSVLPFYYGKNFQYLINFLREKVQKNEEKKAYVFTSKLKSYLNSPRFLFFFSLQIQDPDQNYKKKIHITRSVQESCIPH